MNVVADFYQCRQRAKDHDTCDQTAGYARDIGQPRAEAGQFGQGRNVVIAGNPETHESKHQQELVYAHQEPVHSRPPSRNRLDFLIVCQKSR